MTLSTLTQLLDRMPGYRVGSLLDVFPRDTNASLRSLNAEYERAQLLLDIQDTVFQRYNDVSMDPRHTVGFNHRGHTYLAAHYDWGGSIVTAMAVSATARSFALWNGLIAGEGLLAPNNALGRAQLLEDWIQLEGGMVTTADNALTRGIHNTCFRNTGYTFANVIDAFDVVDRGDHNRRIDLDNPALLFYDGAGNLTGCGYIRPLTSATDPDIFAPELAPLRAEWFAHPPGKHTDDGGFDVHEHDGDVSDQGRNHVASWDMHIFFNLEETARSLGVGMQIIEVSPAGVPVVGPMTGADEIDAPPNVARAASDLVVGKVICADGEASPGFYVDPQTLL